MTDDLWIVVPNWEKFQHYKDRTPPWIKLYLELNHKDEWLDLTDGARGMLVRIWLLTAAVRGPLNASQVRKQGWSKHSSGHLISLSRAGFIRLSASKPLPQRREEVREDARARAREADRPGSLPVNSKTLSGYQRVSRMIQNGAITDPVTLTAEIAGYQIPPDLAAQLHAELET